MKIIFFIVILLMIFSIIAPAFLFFLHGNHTDISCFVSCYSAPIEILKSFSISMTQAIVFALAFLFVTLVSFVAHSKSYMCFVRFRENIQATFRFHLKQNFWFSLSEHSPTA